MRLKRIEAYGFKSFGDKIEIDFPDGVTCIVGPNGCGKSNISDAVRWVLGEQSAANLRTGKGQKMDQVIFKGTEKRKAMGYCEVALTFDNQDRTLAFDDDNVTITRKLYKTGESEYYVNGIKDKLKNIILLFKDTGVGKEGYSLIGQGKISDLITEKPEDRRVIFEEAAGISKFKANRKESIKRLESAKQNLAITEETVRGYEEQIENLIPQAEKAKKAFELKTQIKSLDINHFIYMAEHNDEQKFKFEKEVKEANTVLEDAKKKQEAADAEYEKAGLRVEELEKELREISERLVSLAGTTSSRNAEQKHLTELIEENNTVIDNTKKIIETDKKSLVFNTEKKEKSDKDYTEIERLFLEAQGKEVTVYEEYKKLDEDYKKKEGERAIANGVLLNAMNQSENISVDVAKLETEKLSLEQENSKLRGQLEEKKIEHKNKLQECSEAEKKIAEIDKEIEDNQEKKELLVAELNKHIEAKQAAITKRDEIRQLKLQSELMVSSFKQQKESFGSYDQSVKNLMTCGDPYVNNRVLGVIGDLITVPEKYATAITIALGNQINNIIVRTYEDARDLIEYLKEHKLGACSFMPLEAMSPKGLDEQFEDALDEDGVYGIAADTVKINPSFRKAIDELLGRIVIVEDQNVAIELSRKYRKGFRIVTLAGENYATSGVVRGGSNAKISNALQIDSLIKQYQTQLDMHAKNEQDMNNEIIAENNYCKKIEDSLEILNNILDKLGKDSTQAMTAMQYCKLDEVRLLDEVEKLKETISANDKLICEKGLVLESQKEQKGKQKSQNMDATTYIETINNELRSLASKRTEAYDIYTVCIGKTKELERKKSDITFTKKALLSEEIRLKDNIFRCETLVQNKTKEVENAGESLRKLIAQQSDDESIQELNEKQAKLEKEKEDNKTIQDELFNNMQSLSNDVAEASAKLSKAQTKLENLEIEYKKVSESIKEEYDLEYEQVLEFRDPNYKDSEGTQTRKNLRIELGRLGEINEMAIVDLETKREEYDKIKVQYDDCVNSVEMLEKEIKVMTTHMETLFKETFDKINENFGIVFKQMYSGGHGELSLIMEPGESVLDAGIQIHANPPGKKLDNLNLLSGGEQALVAITLIFAIIRLKPVPFCILDEVDAPLDEANDRRYAQFLQRYKDNTQFIIVSHRIQAIELADTLYGVTMQEKGISKILSVKLSEAIELAKKADKEVDKKL